MPSIRRRPVAALVVVAALGAAALITVAVPAAATTVPGDTATDDATAPGNAGTAAFPVTIATEFGDVTIDEEPQRVVTVGYTDQDYLLALGVIPVGIRDWYGDQPFATWPWARDELGDAEPTVLGNTEINYEAIAALEPDLIVGATSGMTDEHWRTLSEIAPTIPQAPGYQQFGMPWQETFRLIAAAVGRSDAAEEQIAALDARFAEARAAHPEFVGKTAAVAFWYDDQPGAYASLDPRSVFLIELGFVIPPVFDELAEGSFYASFSAEQADLLDVDVLVWVAATDSELEPLFDNPLLDQLAVRKDGREVYLDPVTVGAFSFNSPLSLDHVLDVVVPQLALATDDDPGTVSTAPA